MGFNSGFKGLNMTLEGSTTFCAGQHMDLLIFLGSMIVVISLYEY